MKENQNRMLCDLKGCENDAESLLPLKKDEKGFWYPDKVQNCVVPHAISSHNNQDVLEKDTKFFTDKSVTKCELLELIVCYRERTDCAKDICIDEGMISQEKIVAENRKGGHVGYHDFQSCPDNDKVSDLSKEKVGDVIRIPNGVKNLEEKDCNKHGGPKESIHTSEADVDGKKKAADDIAKERIMPESMLTVGEMGAENSLSELSNFDGNEIEQSDLIPGEAVISRSYEAEESKGSSTIDELSFDRKVENGNITFDLNSSTPEASSQGQNPVNGDDDEQPHEAENMSRVENERSCYDAPTVPCQLHHGPGEKSLSAAVPLSGVITYSGPMAYSGSLSLRSDSSTTSTRSFAFPILQSEWNSSPVKMAKANRKHFRKRRSWRQGILCCRF